MVRRILFRFGLLLEFGSNTSIFKYFFLVEKNFIQYIYICCLEQNNKTNTKRQKWQKI